MTVVVYDVSCDGRRGKLHALLRQYGVAVQLSAFEARLTTREREQMIRQAARIIDAAADRVIVYTIAGDQEQRIACLGQGRPTPEQATFFIA